MGGSVDTTRTLAELADGDSKAASRLMPLVYDELRALAARRLGSGGPEGTLQPTALVHEAYLRLVDQTQVPWNGRTHFFAVAAQMVHRALVDHVRRQNAAKRGGDRWRVSLSAADGEPTKEPVDLLDLEAALEELGRLNERHQRIVFLRFHAGLTHAEIAEVLGISEQTARRGWRMARAWLRRRLER